MLPPRIVENVCCRVGLKDLVVAVMMIMAGNAQEVLAMKGMKEEKEEDRCQQPQL
jgi:hypothetical protein